MLTLLYMLYINVFMTNTLVMALNYSHTYMFGSCSIIYLKYKIYFFLSMQLRDMWKITNVKIVIVVKNNNNVNSIMTSTLSYLF